jgi:hypothetical protein
MLAYQRPMSWPINDFCLAYQRLHTWPIGDPAFGLSATAGIGFLNDTAAFSDTQDSLTRARDLNRSLTLLTRIHNPQNLRQAGRPAPDTSRP